MWNIAALLAHTTRTCTVSSQVASQWGSTVLRQNYSKLVEIVRKRAFSSAPYSRRYGSAGSVRDMDQNGFKPKTGNVKKRDSSVPWKKRQSIKCGMPPDLLKLSLEDIPVKRQKPKDSRKQDKFKQPGDSGKGRRYEKPLDMRKQNQYETLFGVSPCLLALSQSRRKAHGLFVKEGNCTQRESLQQVCEEAQRRGVEIHAVSKGELDRMSGGRVHQGLCLLASPLGYLLEETHAVAQLESSANPLWLVLDAVQDPMNLGAILRSAYFLGVDRVASSLHNSCPLTPVVSKASSGVMEIMEVYGYHSLTDMLKVKLDQGWQVIGTVGAEAHVSGISVIQCSDFQMTQPTLLLMGGEGNGLSPELRVLCEAFLTIPPRRELNPYVESLNVSVATGILLHSVLSSQRR